MTTARPQNTKYEKLVLLSLLFSSEVVIFATLQLPDSLNLTFAFTDAGANLTADYFFRLGYLPNSEFGYHYGLLSLLLSHLWFSALGATPLAYQASMTFGGVAIAVGLARFAVNLDLGKCGLAFLLVALPIAIRHTYWNFSHMIEALLLCHAVGFQAEGRLRMALAMATLSIFAKPAMGYFYGFVLILLMTKDLYKAQKLNWANLANFVLPSVLVVFSVVCVLMPVFGWTALIGSLLPFKGAREYAAQGLGILGAGRYFFYFPGVRPGYYVGTVAGIWIVGTAWLICAGIYLIRPYLSGVRSYSPARVTQELILTLVVLQVLSIALFFGTNGSWSYYSYLFVMGVAATSLIENSASYGVFVLTLLALLSQKGMIESMLLSWRTMKREETSGGLWAGAPFAAEWAYARKLAEGRRATVLTHDGCAGLLFPEFQRPASLYLYEGSPTTKELARENMDLSSATLLVVPSHFPADSRALLRWPEFADTLKEYNRIWTGKYFEVFAKRNLAAGSQTVPAAAP